MSWQSIDASGDLTRDSILLESPRTYVSIPLTLRFLTLYLVAITVFGKGPTYIGVPPVFWGEVVLLLASLWVFLGVSARGIPSVYAHPLGLTVATFLVYGAFHTLFNYPVYGITALRDAAICYYAVFFFIGLHIAMRPKLAEWLWRWLCTAWIISIAWMVIVRYAGPTINQYAPKGGFGYPITTGSGSENAQHAATGGFLLLYKPNLKGALNLSPLISIPLIVISLALLFCQPGRGVKLAVLSGWLIAVLATMGRRNNILMSSRALVLTFFLILGLGSYAIYLGPEGFNTYVREVGYFERFEGIRGAQYKGTAYWRWVWWVNIVNEVNTNSPAFGIGFGRNLSDFSPFYDPEGDKHPLRAPHNYNLTIFGRMGYLGLLLWILILLYGIGGLIRRIRSGGFHDHQYRFNAYTPAREKELVFWLFFLVATLINSSFGVLMEGPVLGVWFWFALGFSHGRAHARPSDPGSRRQEAGNVSQPAGLRVSVAE